MSKLITEKVGVEMGTGLNWRKIGSNGEFSYAREWVLKKWEMS
jgi:hypothetical protein